MAIFSTSHAAVRGISGVVPETVFHNNTYDWISESEREMLVKTTGVARRHVASFGITAGDLCMQAANQLMQELNWSPSEIDVLVFVSQSRDYVLPSTACILQHRLGLSQSCVSFDLVLGCSGYVYGLSVISSMLSSSLKKGLLLVGDISSLNTSYFDKSTFPLFGDAGSCTAIEFNKEKTEIRYNLQTDGAGHESIIIRDGGLRNYVSKESLIRRKVSEGIERNAIQLELNGIDVFNFSLKEVAPNIKALLENADESMDSIDYFVFHQANKLINESIRKKLKINTDKFPSTLENYGNTSSASIPLTIVDRLRDQIADRSVQMLLCGFGVGLSWGSCILQLNQIALPPIKVFKQ